MPPVSTAVAAPPIQQAPEGAASPKAWGGVWALLRRLHFYAGVFVAPFLAVAALTGLAYAFSPQLDALVYGRELRVEQVGDAARPLAEQVALARGAHPEGAVAAVAVADDPAATTRVVLAVPELGEEHQRTVFVDPYSGEVRGALTTWFGSTPLTTWFDDLHRNLHLGAFGRFYSEIAASWLWVVVLGGLTLWLGRGGRYRGRGGRGALAPDLSARGVRRTRSWHASIGVWLALGLLFVSLTGLTWSRYAGANFSTLLTAANAGSPELDATLTAAGGSPVAGDEHHEGAAAAADPATADLPAGIAIDEVVGAARAAGLSGPLEVSPPADDASAWTVAQTDTRWPVRQDQVAIDPATGEVLATNAWADYPLLAKLSSLGINAHMGLLFGLPNQLLLAALALGLLSVIVWGYRSWWQRRPTRADRSRPLGSPPPRGTWRDLPPVAAGLGAVLTLLICWALPVLGVTLLGFLALDAALGLRRRRRSAGSQAA